MAQAGKSAPATLVLELEASLAEPIGFAEVFEAEVVSVRLGSLAATEISLTVLPADKARLALFQAHQKPGRIEAGFARLRTGERFPHAPVTGFVDGDGTVWQLTHARSLDP